MATRRALLLGAGLLAGMDKAWASPHAASTLRLPDGQGALQPVIEGSARLSYLDFWASWCGPCRQSFPWLNGLHQRLAGQGLRVVGLNLDSQRADADRFLSELPAQFTVLFDPKGQSARQFGIKGMPSSALLDAQGRLLWLHSGFKAGEAPLLEARIRKAMA